MEDVWKDINLTCLQECPASNTNRHPAGMILQDFLVRPLNRDPPPNHPSSPGSATDFLNALAPTPATVLTLNSGSDFEILETGSVPRRSNNPQLQSHASADTHSFGSLISPFGALGSSSVFPSICKKGLQEKHDNTSDRRHKRMIKNRVSAARSRAYTEELEKELAHLQKENATLRRQQEKFLAAPAQLPRKHSLCRTSTAPF